MSRGWGGGEGRKGENAARRDVHLQEVTQSCALTFPKPQDLNCICFINKRRPCLGMRSGSGMVEASDSSDLGDQGEAGEVTLNRSP